MGNFHEVVKNLFASFLLR